MEEAERQEHYAANVDEILTPGTRLKFPGQVLPSLLHSEPILSAPLSSAVGSLRFATVNVDFLEK